MGCRAKKSWRVTILEGGFGVAYLGARDAQEADGHEHTADGDLIVAELDAIQILHAQGVRCNETIEGENLVHLNRCNERAPALTDDMRNCETRRWHEEATPVRHEQGTNTHLL